jgi:hypothetical protein
MIQIAAGNGFAIRVPFMTVANAVDGALRLDGWRGGPNAAPEPSSAGGNQLASLCRALTRHCDPWRRNQHRFLECYFDFVARHVENHRDELTRRLDPFAGLFQYRDWVYSALMPLPRAHIHAPDSGEPFGPESLVPVDFAFWTGSAAIVVEMPGKTTRSPITGRRHDRLRRSGAKIVELTDDMLEPANTAEFEDALPAGLHRFWHDIALPAGPLKPAALDIEAGEI